MGVSVVILNYNGWQDTLACVESVLASAQAPERVFIIDNASTNDSLRWFRHWAAGRLEFLLPELGAPDSCRKPLPLLEIDADAQAPAPAAAGKLVLVRASANRGYAAGNNAGIRLAVHWGAEAVWILNNDVIVDKEALGAMHRRLFSKGKPGLCGSLIKYADSATVQCRAGGYANKWTGLSVLDGNGEDIAAARRASPDEVERRINFIYGASVMVSRAFIEQVGLMDERFFLYCEEQDWAYSAGGRFDFAYAPDAVAHHKEGGTTGFSSTKYSSRALWHLTRSRLLLTWKHAPAALPTVCLTLVFAALRMAWRRLLPSRQAACNRD